MDTVNRLGGYFLYHNISEEVGSSISTPWSRAGQTRIGIRALLISTPGPVPTQPPIQQTPETVTWVTRSGHQANPQATLRDQPTALQNKFSEKRNFRTKICDTFTMHAMFTAKCDALYFAKDKRVYKVFCLPIKRCFTAPRSKLQWPGLLEIINDAELKRIPDCRI